MSAGYVEIQVQLLSGNWQTVNSLTMNDDVIVNRRLAETKRRYPDKQCRAIDSRGNILNIM